MSNDKSSFGWWMFLVAVLALATHVTVAGISYSIATLQPNRLLQQELARASLVEGTYKLKVAEVTAEREKSKERIACGEEAINDMRKLCDHLMAKIQPGEEDTNAIVAFKLTKIIMDYEIRMSGGKPEESEESVE